MSQFNESPTEREAQELVNQLQDRGISLRLEGNAIKWSTRYEAGLTIADIRAIKRLDVELKARLDHHKTVHSMIDGYVRDRDGGAA